MSRFRSSWTGALLLFLSLSWQPRVWGQWQQVNDDGFDCNCNTTVALVTFDDLVFAAANNPGGASGTSGVAKLYRLGNPLDATGRFWWTEVRLPSTGIPGMTGSFEAHAINAMTTFAVSGTTWLYVAASGEDAGDGVLRNLVLRTSDGRNWERTGEIWDTSEEGEILAFEVFNNRLYASMGDVARVHREQFRILRTDGGSWDTLSTEGITLGPGDHYFGRLKAFGGYLYAGTFGLNESEDPERVAEVWRTRNGIAWEKAADLQSPTMAEVKSMEVFKGRLYVGTKNHTDVLSERVGPELWRTDGRHWEKIPTAGQFNAQGVHLDALHAYHNVLYAGVGGPYAQLYRSVDGEIWEEITPAGIREHPEEDNYLVGSLLGFGEYVFLATGLNTQAGTEVWRLANLRTRTGPELASHDGELYLLHGRPSDDRILETVYRDNDLLALGPVHDQNARRSWAYTRAQPTAFGVNITGLLVGARYLRLVFKGHNNDRIWYTAKRSPGRGWYWDTPEHIPDTHTSRPPGATMFNWAGPTGPALTIAYRGTLGSTTGPNRIYYRIKEGTRWSPEYVMPDTVRTFNGPEIISFNGALHVFYRGDGLGNNEIYVARKESNQPSDTRWQISGLPRAFTRASSDNKVVSAVVYDGQLLVAYVGHNNDHIWLRRSGDGATWARLGYIRGITTRDNPTLSVLDGRLYLAFKLIGNDEVCIGTLDLRGGQADAPGHTWTSLRPMHCRMD